MTKQEAAKLLSLVKLSYPASYRDIDAATAGATVTMWEMTFADVPYAIMERAFDRHRMESKYPPTVAEMAAQLRRIHYRAEEMALLHRSLGNEQMVQRLRQVMACTARFERENIALSGRKELADGKMGSAGASSDRLGLADGVSQLDAGAGSGC